MENSVNLEPKIQPRQKRAKATYERLLDVAARLLEEEGVERISTNMIAERAGVTVPALYRYFPNKYAVLRALGDRLMERQNEVAMTWLSEQGEPDPVGLFESAEDFMLRTITVTVEQPGGLAACSPDGPQDSRTAEEIAEDARTRLPEDPVLAEKYARSCMTCHGDPMNGAPLSGDVKAWAKRLEWRGKEGLLQSTLNGFGAMPPLGLCPDCSVEDFKKLIAFLANQPQPDAGS